LSPTNVANITEWASRKGYLPFIASVIEDGPYKVKINCTSPFAPLLPYLAHPAALIVSPSAKLKWGVDFTKNPVGSGPFKLVQWVSGEKIVLAKNENFWGGVPKLDEVIYLPVPETTTRVAMLKTGQADVIHDIPFTELGELRANPDVYLQSYLSVRPISIGLNCGRFPFNITKIRQAMNYAIDKQALIDTILGGQGIIQDCPASPDTFGYHASTLFEYNLTKARGLMAEAGYPDGFTQEFVSWANTKYYKNKELHLAIAGYLAQIGIRVRVEVLEQTTLLTKTGETDPMKAGDMFNQAWAPSNADSDWILRPLYYSVPAKYTTSYVKFYNNSRVDELIMEGLTEPNRTARSEIYAEAHEIVFSEAPCIWLYYSKITAGLRSNVHAVQILPVDVYLFREFAYKS
jgi:ABC-type transport system substrate-binding protein